MNIKQKRVDAGITQEQLSKMLGIDRSAVAKWETGEAMPRADKLPKLAKFFQCTVDDLLQDME